MGDDNRRLMMNFSLQLNRDNYLLSCKDLLNYILLEIRSFEYIELISDNNVLYFLKRYKKKVCFLQKNLDNYFDFRGEDIIFILLN